MQAFSVPRGIFDEFAHTLFRIRLRRRARPRTVVFEVRKAGRAIGRRHGPWPARSEIIMTSRRMLLSGLLSLPVLASGSAHASGAWPRTGAGAGPAPIYRTRPGTHEPPPRHAWPAGPNPSRRLACWNEAALRAIAVDAVLPYPGEPMAMPDQYGVTRSSRAVAIVQLAVFDALNAICPRYPAYAADAGPLPAFADSSPDAAIAQAAHDTLAALYPRQKPRFERWLEDDLARLPGGRATLNGIEVGRRAAAAILALRADDGFYQGEPEVGVDYPLETLPGRWRPDPVSRAPVAFGAYWGRVKPFVLDAIGRWRLPPPPALSSAAYTAAFDEVRRLGGNGVLAPTARSAEQTRIGLYWCHDGGAWVGFPPRQYNQIAVQLALARTRDPLDLARLLAMVNVAIADATIAAWDNKYHYDYWRPVTGIREASPGSGPSGLGDGNPDTQGIPGWTPLGASASNLIGPDFTPPFPAYPSGHASLGSAMFQLLRRFYGDAVGFTFTSDECNGVTRDNQGWVRPRLPRSYGSLSQAEEENGMSRIYIGVHWRFDKTSGSALGRRIGDYVFERGLVRPGA